MNRITLLAALVLQLACAKDRNVDDYKEDRLRENLAKLQAVEGRYSGFLVSKKTGNRLGVLQLKLEATTQPTTGNDESKPAATPVVKSTLEFRNSTTLRIEGQKSYYDPNSGQFQTEIPIQQNGKTISVNMNGVLREGRFTGSLEALGYSEDGGTTDLVLNGKGLEELAQESDSFSESNFTQKNFSGTTRFSDGTVRGVHLNLLRPPATSEEDFLSLLTPVRSLVATLNYGGRARISFGDAQWDLRSGALTGQTAVNVEGNSTGTVIQLLLGCQVSANANGDIDCNHRTSSIGGVIAQSQVRASQEAPPMDGPSEARDPMTRSYEGSGEFEPGKIYAVELRVQMPGKTRAQEIMELFQPPTERLLNVNLFNPRSSFGTDFLDTKWDLQNSRLDGVATQQISGQTARFSISCQNFSFPDAVYEFNCSYYSSLRGVSVPVRFRSKG